MEPSCWPPGWALPPLEFFLPDITDKRGSAAPFVERINGLRYVLCVLKHSWQDDKVVAAANILLFTYGLEQRLIHMIFL